MTPLMNQIKPGQKKTSLPAGRKKQYTNQNFLESLKSIGSGVVQAAKDNAREAGKDDLWQQILGPELLIHHDSGDLQEGQELDLSKKQEDPPQPVEPGIDYRTEVIHTERKTNRLNQELEVKIQEIVIELKELVKSSKEVEIQFKDVVVDQRIENPGQYHVNFFQTVLSLIRHARLKVEDSGAWLSAFKSKKAQKGYWQMFKKHGTSFGMSNERSIATQAG